MFYLQLNLSCSIWGTKQYSVINNVQNKAGKDTVSCHPIRRLEAQFDTVVISLSPSVRFNLHISRMHETGKLFLAVGKPTSNLAVQGDLGLMTCFNKQKLSCIRLISRLKRTEGDRQTHHYPVPSFYL
jgi:hypothetical protein